MRPFCSNMENSLCRPRTLFLAALVITLPLVLGAWNISMHHGINPNYVEKIVDGKTKKTEILTLFGDPQETKRTADGLIFVYKTFTTRESSSPKWGDKGKDEEPNTSASVDSPFTLEQNLKRKSKEGPVQEVSSTLTIFFGRDGDTVQSHSFSKGRD